MRLEQTTAITDDHARLDRLAELAVNMAPVMLVSADRTEALKDAVRSKLGRQCDENQAVAPSGLRTSGM